MSKLMISFSHAGLCSLLLYHDHVLSCDDSTESDMLVV